MKSTICCVVLCCVVFVSAMLYKNPVWDLVREYRSESNSPSQLSWLGLPTLLPQRFGPASLWLSIILRNFFNRQPAA